MMYKSIYLFIMCKLLYLSKNIYLICVDFWRDFFARNKEKLVVYLFM